MIDLQTERGKIKGTRTLARSGDLRIPGSSIEKTSLSCCGRRQRRRISHVL